MLNGSENAIIGLLAVLGAEIVLLIAVIVFLKKQVDTRIDEKIETHNTSSKAHKNLNELNMSRMSTQVLAMIESHNDSEHSHPTLLEKLDGRMRGTEERLITMLMEIKEEIGKLKG